jgi:signal transduction histidine kinase/heme/copper-type cytochrome/quinol oxidase subunit 2
MFRKRSITKTYFIIAVCIIIILFILFSSFVIYFDYREFARDSENLRSEYIKSQKEIIEYEVNRAVNYIEFSRDRFEEQAADSGEAEYTEEEIQQEIIQWIQGIRFSESGYILVSKFDGIVLAHYRPEHIGSNLSDLTDPNGVKIHQAILEAGKEAGGGYTEYIGTKNPKTGKPGKKITFVRSIEDWKWLIGSGFYVDNVEEVIDKREIELYNQIKTKTIFILIIFLSVIGILILAIFIISRNIRKQFNQLSSYFKKSATVYEKIDKKKLRYKEFKDLSDYINRMVDGHKRAEEKLKHLSNVLSAIRNVNQLITKEKDKSKLIKGVCKNFVETRGYSSAWIALVDNLGKLTETAEVGVGNNFLPIIKRIKDGEFTDCWRKAISSSDVIVIKDPKKLCLNCSLSANCSGKGVASARLEYGGKVYGLVCVTVPIEYVKSKEEKRLFAEIAGDIAFALYRLELEEKRKKAEEELEKYSKNLKKMVEDRTKKLKEAQEELIRKEKLALLGQLSGGVGHELRNPLGVMSNAVYFLKETLTDADKTTKEYLDIISSEVNNADKIVSNLLDLSRTKPSERTEVAVSELILKILDKKHPPKDIKVTTNIPKDISSVFIDSAQISQVLANLITNAYQAMADGGSLTINAREHKNKVYIEVVDTGCGISKKDTEKIFEPLYTTKARGIGFGLSVSKNLVEVNGGRIKVESIKGKGTTFTLILPIKESQWVKKH